MSRILPDKPIRTKEEDLFNRCTPAIRIAEIVRSCDVDSESFVVGIEGKWGSGKTSLINLVLENLESEDILKIHFNPWSFSDQNELITDFFDSIASALKQGEKKNGEGIAEKIKSYSFKLLKRSELAIAPEVSFLGIKLKLGTIYKASRGNTLEKQKEAINSLLKETNKRIVIVVDDIDRLDVDEVELVFKLVKKNCQLCEYRFSDCLRQGQGGAHVEKKGNSRRGISEENSSVELPFAESRSAGFVRNVAWRDR